MKQDAWLIHEGEGPLIAAAIHDGHAVRADVRPYLALSDAARLTEQDPCTGEWTRVASTRIIGRRSRFEFDLNRPREESVYLTPADSWGLRVWNATLPTSLVEESLRLYDAFYGEVAEVLDRLLVRHDRLVVYDLHTYNHRRAGPYAAFDDHSQNPEVNVGTGTMDRHRWGVVVEAFIEALRSYNFLGHGLDVRENVKFFGGHFAKWTHQRYGEAVCVLSIEFKKFFMDEWTGEVDRSRSRAIQDGLAATVPRVLSELERL